MIPFRTTAPSSHSVVVTAGLMVANLAVFLYQIGLPEASAVRFLYTYALVPAVFTRPDVALHAGLDPSNFLPFLSNTFMHGNWLHLVFNMWTLWLFGSSLEGKMGRWTYLIFYLACGAAGSIGHFVFNPDSGIPALGASGAIAGVLGGYSFSFPRARVMIVQPILFLPVVIPLPAVFYAAVWFGFQIWQGTGDIAGGSAGGIAWWAHIGGFAAGLGLAFGTDKLRRPSKRLKPWG